MARDRVKSSQSVKGENTTDLQQVLTKIEKLEGKLDSIEEKVEDIEEKLERLQYIEEEVCYTSDRFRVEPLLCDPEISEGDLVAVKVKEKYEQVERHRIVQKATKNTITIVQGGAEVKVNKNEARKIGHSPTLKYLDLQDINEKNIPERKTTEENIDTKLSKIATEVETLQEIKKDVKFLKETATKLVNTENSSNEKKREAQGYTKRGTKKTRR